MTNVRPFQTVEAAWTWAITTDRRAGGDCRESILHALDGLYRRRQITLAHARVLRVWGERRTVPDHATAGQREDAAMWHEAMRLLRPLLRDLGIVVDPSRARDPVLAR